MVKINLSSRLMEHDSTMSSNEKENLLVRVYTFVSQFINTKSESLIDFKRPVWHLLFLQKFSLVVILLIMIGNTILIYLTPFVLTYTVIERTLTPMFWFLGSMLILRIFETYPGKLIEFRYNMHIRYSILHSALVRFLTVDPIHHTFRSSGAALQKIEEASLGAKQFAKSINIELIPTLVSLVVGGVSLFFIGPWFGVLGNILLLIIGSIYVWLQFYVIAQTNQKLLDMKAKRAGIHTEIFLQTSYIRSVFAGDIFLKLFGKYLHEEQRFKIYIGMLNMLVFFFYLFFYYGALLALSWLTLERIDAGDVGVGIASSALITFYYSSRNISQLHNQLSGISENYLLVKDAFGYVQNYGSQSFPVLDRN